MPPRPEGGIEPLRLSSATDFKPAHQTTGAHLGETTCLLSGICTGILIASVKSSRLNYLFIKYFSVPNKYDMKPMHDLKHFGCLVHEFLELSSLEDPIERGVNN
ncbi:hypothetical protein CDAR_373081 [Caerostris darwini]|uniref:Uncharacterized protein n=1 Tax=Caerostris darwini TaxID=1538125 RepID=A0AAV4X9Z4_9ARAC|nr:hypothetical protein CDAR_373081 [Caerostris darwini]